MNMQLLNVLADQCWFHETIYDDGGQPREHSGVNIDKLAELVVKEAISIITNVGNKASNDIPFETSDLFADALRSHFDVE